MNNIIILSALGGDDVAARAIKEQFDIRYPDCKVIIIPINEYAGRLLININEGFHTFCCRFAPWLYGIYFKFMSNRLKKKLNRLGKKYAEHHDGSKIKEENLFLPVKKLKNIYQRFEPKVIVSMQSLPHGLAVAAKKKYNFTSKIVAVLSDYTLDSLYVRFGADGYVVDNHEIKRDLNNFNIEDEKIKVYGLSAFNKFLVKNDKQKMREYFGLPQKKTVILTGGSLGQGKIKEIFYNLLKSYKDINIVAIAGRNERLKSKLEKIKKSLNAVNGFIIGFTTEFDKLLDTADAMICKPGAMSVNEAFLKGVPVIAVYPMPSVESADIEYFKQKNLALCADNSSDAAEKLDEVLNNTKIREELITNITKHAKKNAAKNIADYIYSLIDKK